MRGSHENGIRNFDAELRYGMMKVEAIDETTTTKSCAEKIFEFLVAEDRYHWKKNL